MMGTMINGLTVPPAGSAVTDPTEVIVVCDEGYSVPLTASIETTCQAVTYSCNSKSISLVEKVLVLGFINYLESTFLEFEN